MQVVVLPIKHFHNKGTTLVSRGFVVGSPLDDVLVLRPPLQKLQHRNLSLHAQLVPGLIELVAQLIAYLPLTLLGDVRPVDGFVEFGEF